MRLYLRLLAAILAICVLVAAAGCNRDEGKRRPAEKQPRLGFSIADERRDGNRTIKKAVEARARRDDLKITWKDAKGDPQQQERDIDAMIDQDLDAVVVQFADPLLGPGMVRRLTMNKIKVVALETLPPDSPVDGFIASDHAAIGTLLARYLAENTPPGGAARAVMLSGDPQDPMARTITEALREALDETDWTLETHDHPRGEVSAAATTVDEVLAAGVPAAFLATDGRMAVAAMEKLRARELSEQVLTVGVGADRTAAEALVQGDHDAEVDVMPEQLGHFAYEAALGLAREGRWQYDSQVMDGDFSVPTRITPVRLIEADNVFLLEERYGDLTRISKAPQAKGGGESGSQSGGDEGGKGGEGGGGGDEGKQQPMTRLSVTTQDGKTMEIDVPGEVQSIETRQMSGEAQSGGEGGGGGGGGGGGQGQEVGL